MKKKLFRFFRVFLFPELNRKLLVRLIVIIVLATVLCCIFQPCFISGSSMAPTYHDGGFAICFRLRYLFSTPEPGDMVVIDYFGRRKLLKRVVASAGDTVEFRHGKLFVNGTEKDEPYVKFPCEWNIAPVTVRPGFCFVAGDNRSQDPLEHKFGEVSLKRITGGALF